MPNKTMLIRTCFILSSFVLVLPQKTFSQDKPIQQVFADYDKERLQLFPLESTSQGDTIYNDLLPNEGSQAYLKKLQSFYVKYIYALSRYKKEELSPSDKLSYDILKDILQKGLETQKYHPEYMPANQFQSTALEMGVLGSGTAQQPFKTVRDYENWLKRISAFKVWVDTAIGNFNKGIAAGVVLPKALVIKMIPQMENLAQEDTGKNIFLNPIRNFPASFTNEERKDLSVKYYKSVTTQLIPSYKKLAAYLKNDYLPHARKGSGYNELPNGRAMYNFYVRNYTTTDKTPEEIYQTGLKEVDRIHLEMEKVKTETGYKGTLTEFFTYLKTDRKFTPFKTAEEVLNGYRTILQKIEPKLPGLFSVNPRTPFEIKQTEAFRAASAAAQYYPGSLDGKRAGVFYVPIVDAAKYYFFSMEDLFMHEAIPGHHYQISLQMEDTSLPMFRRNLFLSAFGEGWALYAETLGKDLGLYTDPYQYMGSLQKQIHRAIRLVVDVSLHTGKMNREEAIKYILDNEPVSDQVATAEIERYMAWPGQALSYKIGQLKIEELRDKYKAELGDKFSLKNFHNAVLKGGCMPLNIFEQYMNNWASAQK